MKIEQFHVKNQFVIIGASPTILMDGTKLSSGDYFQSYESMIVFKQYDGKVFLDKNTWDYSKTTGKYRNLFLGEDKKATERKIKSGEYQLVNLN